MNRSRAIALWRGWPGISARWLLAILPLVWLSRSVRWGTVAHMAYRLGAVPAAIAWAAAGTTIAIGAMRWRILLIAYGADPSRLPGLGALLRHYLVGHYFAVLPSGIAGDAVRGYRVQDCLPTPATSYVLLFVERIAGLLGLLTIGAIATFASANLRTGAVRTALYVGSAFAVGLGALSYVLPHASARWAPVRALVGRLPVVGGLLNRIPAAQSARGPVFALVLSVVIHALVVVCVASLIMPLSSAATYSVCARTVPPVILLAYIPITPGGIGQREAAFVHFFGLAGVPAEAALTASLLYFAIMMSFAAVGGVVLAIERSAQRP